MRYLVKGHCYYLCSCPTCSHDNCGGVLIANDYVDASTASSALSAVLSKLAGIVGLKAYSSKAQFGLHATVTDDPTKYLVEGSGNFYCSCPACDGWHTIEVNRIVIANTVRDAIIQAANKVEREHLVQFYDIQCRITIVKEKADEVLS